MFCYLELTQGAGDALVKCLPGKGEGQNVDIKARLGGALFLLQYWEGGDKRTLGDGWQPDS